jgi:signal transduction histidine kinase
MNEDQERPLGETGDNPSIERITTILTSEQEAHQHQVDFQSMLMKISTKYINLPLESVHDAINDALMEIGHFVNADRVYIFDYDFARGTSSNIYEWCNVDITPEIDNLQDLPMTQMPEWTALHIRGEKILIEDVSTLPDDSMVKQILEPQGVKSLLTLPMMSGGESIGFVGFDAVRHHKTYTDKEIALLQLFCEMLVNIRNREKQDLNLQAAKEQAEFANRAKSQFLANMSHEIRTPLNSVMGYLQLLELKTTEPEQINIINKMSESADILLAVINDILDVSKIEAGKMELEQVEFDLQSTVMAAITPSMDRAEQKGVLMTVEIDPAVPQTILGDPLRLRQILINLGNNAVKFTDQGSIHVTVRLQPHPDGEQTELLFEVADTGIGMSGETIGRLFRPFTQADSTLARRYGGTGLGLSITHELVQLMNGRIWVDSQPGQGSRFLFALPLQPLQHLQFDEKAAAEAEAASRGHFPEQRLHPADLMLRLQSLLTELLACDWQAVESFESLSQLVWERGWSGEPLVLYQMEHLRQMISRYGFDEAAELTQTMIKSILDSGDTYVS